MSNSLMSLAPVTVLHKVYLKVPFLSPLLFLFYINNSDSSLNNNAVITLIADDI